MSPTPSVHTPKKELPEFLEFSTLPDQVTRFRAGARDLRDEWFAKYRYVLFDDDCYRITQNQPTNHFNEWFAAIQIYEQFGWLSLVEQYEFANHPRKRRLIPLILQDADLAKFVLLATSRVQAHPGLNGQCPDLLCYAPDFSDWFFCEVKKLGEPQTKAQPGLFRELEKRSGQPVRVATISYG